ncbi:gnk2-like domain-containing protein [Artemisia annua]|uniref:Gnk2-like domain-containing protein n=1 Tax=Artemisia annua TaxID=35608 RepID=A0A2U1LD07_ARTAN|nr:gnk2-like domain-containing protein [Artemisia annua]
MNTLTIDIEVIWSWKVKARMGTMLSRFKGLSTFRCQSSHRFKKICAFEEDDKDLIVLEGNELSQFHTIGRRKLNTRGNKSLVGTSERSHTTAIFIIQWFVKKHKRALFESLEKIKSVGTLAKGRYNNKDVAIAVRKQISMGYRLIGVRAHTGSKKIVPLRRMISVSVFYISGLDCIGSYLCVPFDAPKALYWNKPPPILMWHRSYQASRRKITNGNGTVYAIAQCNLSLRKSVCKDCLNYRYSSLHGCLPGSTGRAIDNGCFMIYSSMLFLRKTKLI